MFKKALTTHDVAKYCNVTPRTVNQWIVEGKIEAYRTPGKHSRIKHEDFIDFLTKFKMPIPAELSEETSKKKILVVDDEKAMVNMIRRLLNNNPDYDIDIALDGFVAGQKFMQFKPDLVVLDLRMPRVDGDSLCKAIRNDPANHHVKILIISGIQDEERIKKIMSYGADDFLQKPFENDELLAKIDVLINQKINKN